MSTRCQIIFEGCDVVIYRHSDGYPEGASGVIKALKASVANFVKWRGYDECYMPAHVMHDLIAEHKKELDKYIRREKKAGGYAAYEQAKYIGYGIESYPDESAYLHGDIEWLYVVKKDGTIEVRKCWSDDEGHPNISNTHVTETVKYGK